MKIFYGKFSNSLLEEKKKKFFAVKWDLMIYKKGIHETISVSKNIFSSQYQMIMTIHNTVIFLEDKKKISTFYVFK